MSISRDLSVVLLSKMDGIVWLWLYQRYGVQFGFYLTKYKEDDIEDIYDDITLYGQHIYKCVPL